MNPNQYPVVRDGTNCLTRAEDRVAEALAESAAFQSMVGADDSALTYPHIFIDEVNGPDGYAFTLDELEERGTCVMVLADPNTSTVLENSESGGTLTSLSLLVIIERFAPCDNIRQQFQQQREVKNEVVPVAVDLFNYLKDKYGHMYLTRLRLEHPKPMVESKKEVVLGMRHGAILSLDFGQGDTGS